MAKTEEEKKIAKRIAAKKYYHANRDKVLASNKEIVKRVGHTWKSRTKEYLRAACRKSKDKMRNDPIRIAKRRNSWRAKGRRFQAARMAAVIAEWKGWRGDPFSDVANLKYRQMVFANYGGRCTCCGEDNFAFLTVDHVNGDGNALRKSGEDKGFYLYKKLIKRGYPSGYQLLCWNCNITKHIYGECPHQLVLKARMRLAG